MVAPGRSGLVIAGAAFAASGMGWRSSSCSGSSCSSASRSANCSPAHARSPTPWRRSAPRGRAYAAESGVLATTTALQTLLDSARRPEDFAPHARHLDTLGRQPPSRDERRAVRGRGRRPQRSARSRPLRTRRCCGRCSRSSCRPSRAAAIVGGTAQRPGHPIQRVGPGSRRRRCLRARPCSLCHRLERRLIDVNAAPEAGARRAPGYRTGQSTRPRRPARRRRGLRLNRRVPARPGTPVPPGRRPCSRSRPPAHDRQPRLAARIAPHARDPSRLRRAGRHSHAPELGRAGALSGPRDLRVP